MVTHCSVIFGKEVAVSPQQQKYSYQIITALVNVCLKTPLKFPWSFFLITHILLCISPMLCLISWNFTMTHPTLIFTSNDLSLLIFYHLHSCIKGKTTWGAGPHELLYKNTTLRPDVASFGKLEVVFRWLSPTVAGAKPVGNHPSTVFTVIILADLADPKHSCIYI